MKTSWLITAVVISGLTFFGLVGGAAYWLWPQPSTLHHDLASLRWKLDRPLYRLPHLNLTQHWDMVASGMPSDRSLTQVEAAHARLLREQWYHFTTARAAADQIKADQYRQNLLATLKELLKDFP